MIELNQDEVQQVSGGDVQIVDPTDPIPGIPSGSPLQDPSTWGSDSPSYYKN